MQLQHDFSAINVHLGSPFLSSPDSAARMRALAFQLSAHKPTAVGISLQMIRSRRHASTLLRLGSAPSRVLELARRSQFGGGGGNNSSSGSLAAATSRVGCISHNSRSSSNNITFRAPGTDGTPSPAGRPPLATLALFGASSASVAESLGSLGPGLPRGDYADLSSIPLGALDLSLVQTTIETGDTWIAKHIMSAVSYAHSSLGLEWWAAIVGTTLAIRGATAVFFFSGIKAGAKMMEHQGTLMDLMKRVQAAQQSGDTERARAIMMERLAFVRKNKLQMWRMFLPMVIQMPTFIGLFSAMRLVAQCFKRLMECKLPA